MNTDLRLYYARGANCADRVRWQLAWKSIACELIDVDSAPPSVEFSAGSPYGRVPLLVHEGRALSESMAIAEYIEELHPAPSLLGASPWERAQVREICQVVNASIHPVQNTSSVRFYLPALSKEEIVPLRVRWLVANLARLQPRLWRQSAFVAGAGFTLADIYVASIYRRLRLMAGVVPEMAAFESHLSHLLAIPAIRAACPDVP